MSLEKENGLMRLNMQFFAEEGEGGEEIDPGSGEKGDPGAKKNPGKNDPDSKAKEEADAAAKKAAKAKETQEANKMAKAKKAALEELGIDPDDAKVLGLIKNFASSLKTEEQKTLEDKVAQKSQLAAANLRVKKAEAKAEALQAGCQKQYVDDIVELAIAKAGDEGDIATAIAEMKTKYASFFKEDDDDDGKNAGKKGTGSSIKTGDNSGEKGKTGLGARLAAKRKGNDKKSSFWA